MDFPQITHTVRNLFINVTVQLLSIYLSKSLNWAGCLPKNMIFLAQIQLVKYATWQTGRSKCETTFLASVVVITTSGVGLFSAAFPLCWLQAL